MFRLLVLLATVAAVAAIIFPPTDDHPPTNDRYRNMACKSACDYHSQGPASGTWIWNSVGEGGGSLATCFNDAAIVYGQEFQSFKSVASSSNPSVTFYTNGSCTGNVGASFSGYSKEKVNGGINFKNIGSFQYVASCYGECP
mmetsp:Transcript_22510/g.53227  ORF Transcript_22510/g.53227 Transcript_22510/m.53227 type:complete len:142 (-) Transcript_22510:94-519(-)